MLQNEYFTFFKKDTGSKRKKRIESETINLKRFKNNFLKN